MRRRTRSVVLELDVQRANAERAKACRDRAEADYAGLAADLAETNRSRNELVNRLQQLSAHVEEIRTTARTAEESFGDPQRLVASRYPNPLHPEHQRPRALAEGLMGWFCALKNLLRWLPPEQFGSAAFECQPENSSASPTTQNEAHAPAHNCAHDCRCTLRAQR